MTLNEAINNALLGTIKRAFDEGYFGMTLDEAINHALEKAESLCGECAEKQRQLAEWLIELKRGRKLQMERMRFKLENVNNIQHADINLDGIAVITGMTGKSTIAKAVCAAYEINIALDRTLFKLNPRGVLEQLISDGKIQHNGFLVIDEPETHLHPSRQLEAAEAIVMMRKQFGLHVLLTTNSPYFLYAMEVYSAYHKIADQCFYYLAVSKDGGIEFENVNGNIDKIYKEFLDPIQKLEDIKAEIDE